MFTRLDDLGLLTDLYELTMAQAYYQRSMFEPATFSLFIRKLPPNRGYFVAAGLEDVLRYLEEWRFPEESLAYLRSTAIFAEDFLDYLAGITFTGDVWAVPEGSIFFADEPILEVTAPIIEAQVVETAIINQVNLQSLIATKASRCVQAAKGHALSDFALRRSHGIDAGMKVARCSYMAGFQSTSNVLAGKMYGIPISGTMAHSFITSFSDETDAFRAFVQSFPERSVLLIDTYDTVAGAQKAAVVAKEMEARGERLRGVRLDSGDLAGLSRWVRGVLDEAGLGYVNVVASGGLDEFEVDELVRGGAPIDAFGVGTRMGVSDDAPWSDMAYKLVRYAGRPVLKLSIGKVSLPDEKQVFRLRDDRGMYIQDIISLRNEDIDAAGGADVPGFGEPLLQKVMEAGRTNAHMPTLPEIRDRVAADVERLDERVKALRDPQRYRVEVSPGLDRLQLKLESELIGDEAAPAGHRAPEGGNRR